MVVFDHLEMHHRISDKPFPDCLHMVLCKLDPASDESGKPEPRPAPGGTNNSNAGSPQVRQPAVLRSEVLALARDVIRKAQGNHQSEEITVSLRNMVDQPAFTRQ